MKQRHGSCLFAWGFLVFVDLCSATSNDYSMIASILNEARALRVSGDVYKAEALLTRAQRIAPRSADVYLEMAYLRKAQGDYTGLREVVDFGSDIANGPPASIAQLRILREKLMVLLPLDAETPFQLPPAVAIGNVSLPEEISSRQGNTILSPEDAEPEKFLTEPAVDANSVSESDKSTLVPGSGGRTNEVQLQSNRKIENVQESDESQGPKLVASDFDKPEQSEALGSTGAVTEKVATPRSLNGKRVKFFGAGILAKPQPGSWISRGTIEKDY